MKNITLIGSGNVATQLALSLKKKGYNIKQVWSKQLKNANILAKKIDSSPIESLKNLESADIYILAVKDDAITEVIKEMNVDNVIHTSGSTSLEVFNNKYNNYGVLYPLQTFNKNIKQDLKTTPIFIEANNDTFNEKLYEIGYKLSKKVIKIDSIQRQKIHIAAVFACNFTNHMFSIADSIVAESHIDFKLLLPLINQTVKKIAQNKPSKVQTGPARRKDQKIIQNHINKLSNKELKNIYQIISNSIMKNNE